MEKFLGRKYSILGKVQGGLKLGRSLGFPTANLALTGLCLPPFGVYAIKVNDEGKTINGVANLGIAPTVRADPAPPLLETFLFTEREDFYGHEIEVVFHEFIRPEIKFTNLDDLKQRISKDVEEAKRLLAFT